MRPWLAFFFTFLTLASSPRDALGQTARQQVWPQLAGDGAGFLMAFVDESTDSGDSHLTAVRLDQNGLAIGPTIDLGPVQSPFGAVFTFFTRAPYSLAFGGRVYLVAWQRANDVVAVRIDRAGNLLDAQPIVLTTQGYLSDQAIAWNGSNFLVLWQNQSAVGGAGGAFLDEGGGMSTIPPINFSGYGFSPIVQYDGTRFLVAWSVASVVCTCVPTPSGIAVMRLASDGTAIDSNPKFFPVRATNFRLASSGQNSMIVSDMYGYVDQSFSVQANSVDASGTEIEMGPAVTLFRWLTPMISNITWDGMEYVATWRYGAADKQWIGRTRFTQQMTAALELSAEVGPIKVEDRPAIAAIAPRTSLVAFSEVPFAGSLARIRTQQEWETRLRPPVPPAPLITSAVGTSRATVVTWQMAPVEVDGFVIEASYPFAGTSSILTAVPADARSAVVSPPSSYVRMRAFNAGGLSEPTASVPITAPPRNRAIRKTTTGKAPSALAVPLLRR